MQPADDVELRDGLAVALAGLRDALLDRHLVAAGLVDLLRPGAERAVDPAEVRRVQVPVDVVEGEVAVALLADVVGEPAEAQEVAGREEPRRRPRRRAARPPSDLFGDRASRSEPRKLGERAPSRDRGLGHRLEGVLRDRGDVVHEGRRRSGSSPSSTSLRAELEVDDPADGGEVHDLPAAAVAHVLLPLISRQTGPMAVTPDGNRYQSFDGFRRRRQKPDPELPNRRAVADERDRGADQKCRVRARRSSTRRRRGPKPAAPRAPIARVEHAERPAARASPRDEVGDERPLRPFRQRVEEGVEGEEAPRSRRAATRRRSRRRRAA